jgi:signal peptidase II
VVLDEKRIHCKGNNFFLFTKSISFEKKYIPLHKKTQKFCAMRIQHKILCVVLLILTADQVLKIWVKTHLCLGQGISLISNKAYLYFIENPGMAFGMELGGEVGKIALTLLRIVFICIISVNVWKMMRNNYNQRVVYALSIMLAGAAGNTIDCLFYGLLFNESTYSAVAQIFPALGGYAPLMFGKVVDMFYLPIINTTLPEWFPVWGGTNFVFFRPVFNIADTAITCSIFYLLLFQRKCLFGLLGSKDKQKKEIECHAKQDI